MREDSQLSSVSYMTQFPKCGPVSPSPETVNVFPMHLRVTARFSFPHRESLQRQLMLNGRVLFKTSNLIQKF